MCPRLHGRDSWGRETARRETHASGYVWISVCSVFEGLQIIYSPFRRRELFSFDRFIWRWSASCAIASRNIDDAYIHGPSRFSLCLSLLTYSFPFRATNLGSFAALWTLCLCLSLSFYLRLGVFKKWARTLFLRGPPLPRPPPPPFRSSRDSSDRGPVLVVVVVVVVSAGVACNVPHQRMCKNSRERNRGGFRGGFEAHEGGETRKTVSAKDENGRKWDRER